MKRFRTIILLVIISLTVTLSFQLTEMFSKQDIPSDKARIQDEIDYSIENFNLTILDKSGKMQYHLSADSMLHYKDSDITHLQNPNIELFRTPQEQWEIQANSGNVRPGGKKVLLEGKVQIQQTISTQQQSFIITTETLNISPDENTVSTQDDIQLEGNGLKVQAKGMIADLDQQTFQLLSAVRGSYVPPH